MNRRNFLGMLGIGMAGLYLRVCPRIELPPDCLMATYWFQTARTVVYHDEAYQRALEAILQQPNSFLLPFRSDLRGRAGSKTIT